MNHDALFDEFVERLDATGDAHVPAEWPEELRRRCIFFARMVADPETTPFASGHSTVAAFTARGAPASLSLSDEASAPPPGPGEAGERYVVERELGHGGMGRVVLVYDRDFRRRVAMKVLLGPQQTGRLSRFLEEAQATAQLEHPNIAPVYDLGTQEGGAPFFTMKWIRGRNLKEIGAPGPARPSLVRLIQILQQAAMGVHYANARGVVHRDLKPQNIMVGDYGEVLVVDWGLAKVLRAGGDAAPPADALSTDRGEGGEVTLEGSVHGTPAYMAPEQARGEVAAIDARTDVFGLGAALYEVLTGTPPYADPSRQVVLGKARRGAIEPPSRRAPDRSIPRELEEICTRALATRPEDRFPSAGELNEALQRYIEGIHDAERRAAEAQKLLAAAEAQRGELHAAEEEEARLARRAAELQEQLADHDPEERKRPLWELTAELQAARESISTAFNGTTAAYTAVLSIEPEQSQARDALAELYYRRLLDAEERSDRDAVGLYEGLVRQHGARRYRLELEGQGVLRLASEPAGAEVLLSRYEEKGPLLVATPPEPIGRTPLEKALPHGSYLTCLRLPGRVETRYPFTIRRSAAHDGAVRLHAANAIEPGFVQVAGGETIVGASDPSLRTLGRARVLVREAFVARFPVTLGEYCSFLDDLDKAGRLESSDFLPSFGQEEYVVRGGDGRFAPIERLGPDVPVMAILIPACEEYCRWLGSKLGRAVRLLEEVEWERCARGADGRIYPWGNGFDWAFCKGGLSRPGKPFPEPVGAFARDESPFGIRDLAGGVRELCGGKYGEGYRPLRGGSWWNPYPIIFRSDARMPRGEATRTTDCGLRVCYNLEA